VDIDEIERHRSTVTTRYGETSYLDIGAGPPAVFVHGLATSAYLWRNVIAQLADQRRCLAVDLPVHGRSPGTAAQDFSLPGLARFIEDFCAALELPAVDLVANDSGGAIAQVFAALHPDRVATLTLTNCDAHDNLRPGRSRRPCGSPACVCSPRLRDGCSVIPSAPVNAFTPVGSKTPRR